MTLSKVLELSISPDYVPYWGTWEAIRELLQNAVDSRDQGNEMQVDFKPEKAGFDSVLRIMNIGASLNRNTLLLGKTDKTGKDLRGQFGEGYKLALIVLLRQELDITIRTKNEIWQPVIENSDNFGSEVLKVHVYESPNYVNGVEFEVKGVTSSEWKMISERCLFLTPIPPENRITTLSGTILIGEEFVGKLFVKGIYVGRVDNMGTHLFGYDMPKIKLDRDRKMPDASAMTQKVSDTLFKAHQAKKISSEAMYDILNTPCEEARHVEAQYRYGFYSERSSYLEDELARIFKEKHGPLAIPVASTEESIQAQQMGMVGVICGEALRVVISSRVGEFLKEKVIKGRSHKKIYGHEDLGKEELENLKWSMDLVTAADNNCTKVSVVDFYDDKVFGTRNQTTGEISLSKKILLNRLELLSTLVHETAHVYGGDGASSHRAGIEKIFSTIVLNLEKVEKPKESLMTKLFGK